MRPRLYVQKVQRPTAEDGRSIEQTMLCHYTAVYALGWQGFLEVGRGAVVCYYQNTTMKLKYLSQEEIVLNGLEQLVEWVETYSPRSEVMAMTLEPHQVEGKVYRLSAPSFSSRDQFKRLWGDLAA